MWSQSPGQNHFSPKPKQENICISRGLQGKVKFHSITRNCLPVWRAEPFIDKIILTKQQVLTCIPSAHTNIQKATKSFHWSYKKKKNLKKRSEELLQYHVHWDAVKFLLGEKKLVGDWVRAGNNSLQNLEESALEYAGADNLQELLPT